MYHLTSVGEGLFSPLTPPFHFLPNISRFCIENQGCMQLSLFKFEFYFAGDKIRVGREYQAMVPSMIPESG